MTAILAAAALLAIAAVVVTLWVAGRVVVTRALERRVRRQAAEVGGKLAELRARAYDSLDQMLFDMRDLYDPQVLELELRRELDEAGPGRPEALAASFRLLGLTERYLSEIRTARAWRERARAATALGLLRDPRAVRPLVEAMRDDAEDGDVKLACAEALGRLRDRDATVEMCELLADVDEWASPRLAQVLAELGEAALDPLLATLDKSPSLNARVWAVQILGRIGDHRATWPIIERLHDRSESLRLSACNSLAALRDPHAVPPLIDVVLRDPVAAVRAQAARALGELGDDRALPLLIASLGDPDYWMRFRALEAIEALSPIDTSAIEAALADANPEVRRRAVLALDRMGRLDKPFNDLTADDEAASAEAEQRLVAVGRAGLSERLVRYLSAPEATMRARMARVLGQVGEPRHAEALVGALGDADPAVVLEAVVALGELVVPATAGPLIERLAAADRAVRRAAATALRRFDPSALAAHLERLAKLAADPSDDVRVAALEAIAAVRDAAATGILVEALRDRYVDARLTAARALGDRAAHGTREDADALADALVVVVSDSSEPVRVAAAESLGKLGGARAVDYLLAALPTATEAQRETICFHLAALGFAKLAPALDVLMASRGAKARIGVAWTLGKTGDPGAVPLLAALLEEPEPRVRASAAGAIAKLVAVNPVAIEVLSRAVDDPSPYVRSAAINGLGKVKGVTDVLARTLADPDRFVRTRAILAFGRSAGKEGAERLLALDPGEVDPAVAVVALALTGAPVAIGEVMRRLADPALVTAVEGVLAGEDEEVRHAYRDRLRPRTTQRIRVGAAELGREDLADEQATALRISVDPVERRTAAIALGRLGDPAAQRALAEAVQHDPDVAVRREAMTALADAGPRSPALVREAVVDATRDPDADVRATALVTAAAFVRPAEAAPLLDGLRARDARVRDAAEEACARVFPADLAAFHAWIGTQAQDEIVLAGIRVLGRIADAASHELLVELQASASASVRAEAVTALARLATPAAIAAVVNGLRDPAESVRMATVRALGGARRADVVEAMADAALDPSVEVRAALAAALGTMSNTRAIDVLAGLTGDASPHVASRAALALLASPDDEGLAAFLARHGAMSSDARELVRRDAESVVLRVVARLTSAMMVPVRQLALRALAAIDGAAYAHAIALATRDPDRRIRMLAIETLVAVGPERLDDHLRAVIDDPVAEVRAAARRALLRPV